MPVTSRVSIPKSDVLALLRRKRDTIRAQHKREAAAYDKAYPRYCAQVAKALEQAAEAVRKGRPGKDAHSSYGNTYTIKLPANVKLPKRDTRANELRRVERIISLHQASHATKVSLDADEYAELKA